MTSTAPPTMGFDKIPGDRYEVVGRLGSGAFGSVCKAIDTFLNRPVAIKSIRLDTSLDPEERKALNRRFIREAQVAAQLHHANIVTIYDIMFASETGFLVMEYIEGTTLQELIEERSLSLHEVVDINVQIAEALHYAHEHKVIHRDIKPANIMLTSLGEARITDFGIAKADGATHLTLSGSLIGTPDYMSPEQAQGEDVDARTDLFSLGCVVYECAVGRKPFEGGSLTGVLLNIVNSDPLESQAYKSGGFPPELAEVLAKALAKKPADRFATGRELAEALRRVPLPDEEPEAGDTASHKGKAASILGLFKSRTLTPEKLDALKREDRPLRFAAGLSDELQDVNLTPTQGFVLSRIDGTLRPRDILMLSPLPEIEVAETLAGLIDEGLLTLEEPAAAGTRTLSPGLAQEVDRLLELGRKRRYSELLAVNVSSSTAEMKKAYLELIQRFHPDAHPSDLDEESRRRLTDVCALATKAVSALSGRLPKSDVVRPVVRRDFDRSRHARQLFDRAQHAFESMDYWQAIQLARQATELDDSRAEYHHLLGLGLMKNRNWMKEAEESLSKAVELDPNRPEYYDLLATVYKAEGMHERSASMLEKARALDPSLSKS